jgi:hypothetical protein
MSSNTRIEQELAADLWSFTFTNSKPYFSDKSLIYVPNFLGEHQSIVGLSPNIYVHARLRSPLYQGRLTKSTMIFAIIAGHGNHRRAAIRPLGFGIGAYYTRQNPHLAYTLIVEDIMTIDRPICTTLDEQYDSEIDAKAYSVSILNGMGMTVIKVNGVDYESISDLKEREPDLFRQLQTIEMNINSDWAHHLDGVSLN